MRVLFLFPVSFLSQDIKTTTTIIIYLVIQYSLVTDILYSAKNQNK